MTVPNAAPDLSWRETLTAGDIVSFRFPYPDAPAREQARPCLVVDVDLASNEAVLVYGTSRWTKANRGQELHVTGADAAMASLDRPTRFVGARRVRVVLDSARFVAGHRGTPVVGQLAGTLRNHLSRLQQPATTRKKRTRGPWCARAGRKMHRSDASSKTRCASASTSRIEKQDVSVTRNLQGSGSA